MVSTTVEVVTAMPLVEEGAAGASDSARPEGPVGQRHPLIHLSGTPPQHSPRQRQLSDISEDANADPMQDSVRALRQAIAAEDAARKEVKQALRLVREMRAAEVAKEEQRKAQEAEEAERQTKKASMGRLSQPVLYGTTKPAAAWDPHVPSLEETEDLLQQLEELAQQRWTTEVSPPKVPSAVHEVPAQQLLQQTEQAEVPDSARSRSVSEELLQQLQDLDIKCSESAPVTSYEFVGAQQRKGEGSMASTRTPSVAGATKKAVSGTDGKVLAKARVKAAARKADGKGNGRVLRRKANGGDDQRAATKQTAAPAASASSASPSSTTRKPSGRRVPSTPRWQPTGLAHSVVLETVQVTPTPFTCPVLGACQACPESRRAAASNF